MSTSKIETLQGFNSAFEPVINKFHITKKNIINEIESSKFKSPHSSKSDTKKKNTWLEAEEYKSIQEEFTLDESKLPNIFKKSKNGKRIVILNESFKGATDLFKHLTGFTFKDILLGSSEIEMQSFEEKDLANIESNFCYPFIRCLEMNKVIEVCKDIESNIFDNEGKKRIVRAGTIFYNINELRFFKEKNLICVFNKFDKRKMSLINIEYFLQNRGCSHLDKRKQTYIDIILNCKSHKNKMLFGGEHIYEFQEKKKNEEIIYEYLMTQSKYEYYNNIGINNIIGVKGMTLSVPSLQKIDPEGFKNIFTQICKPNIGIFNIKLCDHIFNDRKSRLELGLDACEKETDFKQELISIIEDGIYLVVLNYKVYNVNFGKDLNFKYLCLEMSNYHSSISKDLSVISLITIDNLFFEYNNKLSNKDLDKSQFAQDLENGNKKVTKNLKCNNIEFIRPIRIGDMQVGSKFIKYSHYQDKKILVIRTYEIAEFITYKVPGMNTKLAKIKECSEDIKYYKLCKNRFETLDKWDDLNKHECYDDPLMLSEKFPVLALVNSFKKEIHEYYPKEFSVEFQDKENGLINCGVTAVNTNFIKILKDHQAWMM